MNILILGGAGFIGTHLAANWMKHGASVTILDNFTKQVHGDMTAGLSSLSSYARIVQADLADRKSLNAALQHQDIVYHLVSAVGVGQSMYQPGRYIHTNSFLTAELFEVLRQTDVKRVVLASSMSVYGEGAYKGNGGESVEIRGTRTNGQLEERRWELTGLDGNLLYPCGTSEAKPPDPQSVYALTKFDQERLAAIFYAQRNLPVVVLRLFNVYGEGQSLINPYAGVIAGFAQKLKAGTSPVIYEDGGQIRDFIHVSDVVEALRLAGLVSECYGTPINIGTGRPHKILDVANALAETLNVPRELINPSNLYRPGDIRHCYADITLARNVLGFQPKMELTEGLKRLVDWLPANSPGVMETEVESLQLHGLIGSPRRVLKTE